MENEWREREPAGTGSDLSKDKKSKKEKVDARQVLEEIQTGNYYREKEKAEKQDTVTPGNKNEKKEKKKAPKATTDKKAPKRPNLLVQVLNGDILARDFVVNNLTFIFFILFLLLLVVGKGYYGKQLTKDIDTLQTDVNASTAEYIENKAKLEESTARYRLVEALERKGLKEAVKPAKVIRLKRKKK